MTTIIQSYSECLEAFARAHESGENLSLQNPAGSIHYLGLLYIRHMVEEAVIRYPQVPYDFICDCSDDAPAVMEAIRMGFKTVCYSGEPEIATKLQDMAEQAGVHLLCQL